MRVGRERRTCSPVSNLAGKVGVDGLLTANHGEIVGIDPLVAPSILLRGLGLCFPASPRW